MKLSLKFREKESSHHQNPLLRAKIPVTILGLPFLSGIVAGDSTDLSFSLRSNFSSGPSLSLSYHPTRLTPASNYPFSLSLKSGIGLFGSPHDSPLIFTAHFNLFSTSNPNPSSLTPIFSLQVKPQLGNFSLFKSISSPNSSPIQLNGHPPNGDLSNGPGSDFENINVSGHGSIGFGKPPLRWEDLKRESSPGGILSGIFLAARTSMPLTKRAVVNLRWGVNFPAESSNGQQWSKTPLPVLMVNKISVERVEEAKKGEEEKRVEEGKAGGDLELSKGMCSWMRREMEDLQRENREIKQAMEGMRFQVPSLRGRGEEREFVGKRAMPAPVMENSSEFERWRSKKGGGSGSVKENGNRESKKSLSPPPVSDVESEFEKAIKAASS